MIREWVAEKLDSVFPSAEKVVSKMSLDVSFKDVTFETLNDPEFIERAGTAAPARLANTTPPRGQRSTPRWSRNWAAR